MPGYFSWIQRISLLDSSEYPIVLSTYKSIYIQSFIHWSILYLSFYPEISSFTCIRILLLIHWYPDFILYYPLISSNLSFHILACILLHPAILSSEISSFSSLFIQTYPAIHALISYCPSINILTLILSYPQISSYLSLHILWFILSFPLISRFYIHSYPFLSIDIQPLILLETRYRFRLFLLARRPAWSRSSLACPAHQ